MPNYHIAASALLLFGFPLLSGTSAAEEPAIKIVQSSGKVQLLSEKMLTVIDVVDPGGIGRAELHRTGKNWPAKLTIRLHLKGLEGFRVNIGEQELHWWVSNGPERKTYMAHLKAGKETGITDKSEYWTPVRSIAGEAEKKGFEVTLPAKLLKDNPEKIKLQWIDFYR